MFCIDISGNMIGKREMVVKSVALYMANTAVSQKRACYLINFSINISSLDLTKNADMLVISDFKFAKVSLSKDEAYGARFYGLNVGFEKVEDEFFDEIIEYEQDLSLDI